MRFVLGRKFSSARGSVAGVKFRNFHDSELQNHLVQECKPSCTKTLFFLIEKKEHALLSIYFCISNTALVWKQQTFSIISRVASKCSQHSLLSFLHLLHLHFLQLAYFTRLHLKAWSHHLFSWTISITVNADFHTNKLFLRENTAI